MKASLVLEPAVLAMPALSRDEVSITKAIETIVLLSEALRETDFDICLLSDAANYLAEADLYPVSRSIDQSLADSGLSHVFTTEDIRRSIQNILQQAKRLESTSGVEFLVPEVMQAEPDVLSARTHNSLKESLEVTLAHVALLMQKTSKSNVSVLMADRFAGEEIRLSTDITEITPVFQGHDKLQNLVCTIALVESASSFGEGLDADELWQIAENETEMRAAISVKACKLRKTSGCTAPKENCDGFAIGSSFCATMHRCQSMPSGKYGTLTFESIARLVAKSPTELPKKLYKLSDTGDRVDVVRDDGAIGWRLHVTKSGEGIRLMFWRLRNASIEFANVGPKNDVDIH